MSDFARLQQRCASCRLVISEGCPPRLTGIMWSTVAESGCGDFNDLSTGLPQMPQMFCVARIVFLFASNCCRCAPLRSGLFRCIVSPGGIFKNKTDRRSGLLAMVKGASERKSLHSLSFWTIPYYHISTCYCLSSLRYMAANSLSALPCRRQQ